MLKRWLGIKRTVKRRQRAAVLGLAVGSGLLTAGLMDWASYLAAPGVAITLPSVYGLLLTLAGAPAEADK